MKKNSLVDNFLQAQGETVRIEDTYFIALAVCQLADDLRELKELAKKESK